VFYENQFNGGAGSEEPFSLNSARGDEIYLSAVDAEENLTGDRSQAVFGPAANGVSFGRYETSLGAVFVAQEQRSFGVDDPDTVEAFRKGGGSANSNPWVGPVVINEMMYHPPEPQQTDGAEEYIELYNRSDAFVDLYDPEHPENRWSWLEGIEFEFAQNPGLAAGEFLLVVGFDPETEPARLSAFRNYYGVPEAVAVYGPYNGRLANNGERIGLYRPDPPQTGGADAGFVPYVLVEAIDYRDTVPWPTAADGEGKSLQRLAAAEFGNDPVNWQGAEPTPGSENGVSESDQDGDGLPDSWETAYGLDPMDESDAAGDLDGDGFNNWEEYHSGTDPEDPANYLQVGQIARQGRELLLRFDAKAGKSYAIWYRDSLTDGQWEPLAEIEAEPEDHQVELSDSVLNQQGERYYRLVTPMTP
jgi:hypothetical protein